MHIVFYGPEGSGKGTQAKLLAEKLHVPILTSGDLVRDAITNDKGIIGEVCRQALLEGKYVANSEMEVLWKWRLKEDDAKGAWIMDGFPRNVEQAKFLDDKIDKYGYKVEFVIFLKLPEDVSYERLIKRGRPVSAGSTELHDSPERIKSRLAIYKESEQAVLDYYKTTGVHLVEIDANKSIEEVHSEIMKYIDAFTNAK
ncbi:MAG: adenylate kinase, adenylate kinase [Microgenomates group bacterium GW2011_GWC1_39_12]|nr:MAG: adenylate kinase, adenylate kinase [Microgenomates group bacterium GW2011_GWC1_39_12]